MILTIKFLFNVVIKVTQCKNSQFSKKRIKKKYYRRSFWLSWRSYHQHHKLDSSPKMKLTHSTGYVVLYCWIYKQVWSEQNQNNLIYVCRTWWAYMGISWFDLLNSWIKRKKRKNTKLFLPRPTKFDKRYWETA